MTNSIQMLQARGALQRKAPVTQAMAFAALISVCAYLLAVFGSLDHPWNWFGLRQGSLTRYLPSAAMVASLVLLVPNGPGLQIFTNRFILCAAAFLGVEMIGSVVYILHLHGSLSESYFGRSLSGLALLNGAAIAMNPRLRNWVSRRILAGAIVLGIGAFALLTLHSLGLVLGQYSQIVRVQIVILMAGIVWICIRYPSVLVRVAVTLLMFLNGYLSGKSTNYLMGLMFAALSFGNEIVVFMRSLFGRATRKARFGIILLAMPVVIAFAGAVLFLLYAIVSERATRYEFDVRRVGIELRWKEFLESPIYGTGFASSSNVSGVFGFGDNVPSHNDIMDILAAGGVIGIAVFVATVGAAALGRGMREAMTAKKAGIAPIHYFWFVVVFYILGASGNPFFSEPYMAVPVWFSIGMMLGYGAERRSLPGRDRVPVGGYAGRPGAAA